MHPSLFQAYRFRLRREAVYAGRTGMAPNEWRLTGFEPRAFESALVWMELKSGWLTTRPIAQHTVLLGVLGGTLLL